MSSSSLNACAALCTPQHSVCSNAPLGLEEETLLSWQLQLTQPKLKWWEDARGMQEAWEAPETVR